MDFMNRGQQSTQPTHQSTTHTAKPHPVTSPTTSGGGGKKRRFSISKATVAGKLGFLVLLVALVALALLSLIMFKGNTQESRLVNKDQNQAVFLNGGQVYFGKIDNLNNKFVKLNQVYYLRVNQQVQPNQQTTQTDKNDISLVKLGCELHGPTDEMVINREQVVFWENLKADGQVAKAIDEFKKQYPNGQNCEEQAASQNTPATTQPTTNKDQN